MKKSVYLDHSATTPVAPEVVEKMSDAMQHHWGNPSSIYSTGRDAKIILEEAREQVASLMNAEPENIFFTSGGTEADNLALNGVMTSAKRNSGKNHLLVSSIEHSAVLKTAEYLNENGFSAEFIPVDEKGVVDIEKLESMLTSDTALVSVMHVNNEIGTIQPLKEIAELCHSKNILFHTDAVQSFGKIAIDVHEMGLDLVSVSSHKIYGPKGIGALYVANGVQLDPTQKGGGQEKGIRTGTENLPGIAGFGEACRLCSKHIVNENSDLGELRDKLLSSLESKIDGGMMVNGNLNNRLGANLNVAFEDIEADALLLALDLDGIAISTGSACSSGSTKPSAVLSAIGLTDQLAHSSIRMTLGRSTSVDDIEYAAGRVAYHVNRLRAMNF